MSNEFTKIAEWFAKQECQDNLLNTEYDKRPILQRIIIFAAFIIMFIIARLPKCVSNEAQYRLFLLYHYINKSNFDAISKSQIDFLKVRNGSQN